MKKLKLTVIIFLLLLLAFTATASAKENIMVFVDGKAVAFPDQKPYVDKNFRTLVPVRFVSEALGAKVDWDGKNRQVFVADEIADKEIKLWVGKREYRVNGVEQLMDTEAVLTAQKRVMVPMRFISEALGVYVDYKNVEGLGLVFNFTRDFPKESIQETIDRITEEIKKSLAEERVSGFLKPNPDNMEGSTSIEIGKRGHVFSIDIRVPEDRRYAEVERVFTSKYSQELFNEVRAFLDQKKDFGDTYGLKFWNENGASIHAIAGLGYVVAIKIYE